MSIEWKPIETFNGLDETAYLLWDKSNDSPVVARRVTNHRGNRWYVYDSYGHNEDGEIYATWISHWAVIEGPR